MGLLEQNREWWNQKARIDKTPPLSTGKKEGGGSFDQKSTQPIYPLVPITTEEATKNRATPPTDADKKRARSVTGELADEKGHVRTRDVAILGGTALVSAAAGAGIATLVDRVVFAESVPGGTSFSNDGSVPQIEGLPPQEPETKKVNPKEIFDNRKDEGVISPENILPVPKDKYVEKTHLADEDGNPIFDFPRDQNFPGLEIQYKKSQLYSPGWWKSGPPDSDIRDGFKGKNLLPAGYELPTLYPGRVFFAGTVYDEEASGKSLSNPDGLAVHKGPIITAAIKFIAPNGTLYSIGIVVRNKENTRYLELKPLIDVSLSGLENGNGKDWEKGTLVERLQPIFRIPEEGILHMSIGGQRNGSLYEIDHVPGNFAFQEIEDERGVTKLPVPEGR